MGAFPSAAAELQSRQQSPFQQVGQFLSLQQLLNQQKTQGLQQTGMEQENQLKALQLEDAQTLRSIAPNHVKKDADGNITGFDTESYLNEAAGKKVNPQTLNQIRLTYADTVQKTAAAGKAHLDLENSKNDQAYQILEGVRGISDPVKRQQAVQAAAPKLQALGVDPSGLPQTVDDAAIKDFEAHLGVHKQVLTDAETQAKTNESNQKANLEKMEAAEKGSPLTKMENDPTMFAGEKLPASMAYLQSKIGDRDPETAARAKRLLSTAQVSRSNQLAMEASKKATDQAIMDGDPNAAAKLLVDGTVAPSQLISSRKPEFAQKAFTAAAQMQPGWDARKAEADFKVAGSPTNVAFFGSAKSLTDKGGTLDQLAAAGKDIPQNEFKPFNTIEDAWKTSVGSGPMAKYASIALGVADDYSKVMGGGQGSDTSRAQALKLIGEKLIPEERAGAIEGIRGAVGSQTNSRIGNNSVMQKMYGSQMAAPAGKNTSQARPAGATMRVPGSDGKLHWSDGKKDLGVVE
jgi:hypothetical protein